MSALYKSLESLRLKTAGDLDKAQAKLDSTTPDTDAHTVARITVEAETAKLQSIEASFGTILVEAGVAELIARYNNGLITIKELLDLIADKLAELNS